MVWYNKLILWYEANKRDLPWRHTKDPYHIWLSEVILQQTRVFQGLSYYRKFITLFPNIIHLAETKEEMVLKTWQGLGYYSRARNLHKAARQIVDNFNGQFPKSYEKLLDVHGIGPYTAAAIASFAFGERVAVVDGNVYRLLARYLGIQSPINTEEARKIFSEEALKLMGEGDPALFNQAIMEFGATYCVPRTPNCNECVFKDGCYAFAHGETGKFPVKQAKAKVKKRYLNYFHFTGKGKSFLTKRTENDIWKNLYELPMYESKGMLEWDELINEQDLFEKNELEKMILEGQKTITHRLTHRKIFARFWKVCLKDRIEFSKNNIFEINEPDIDSFAVSRLTEKYLEM